MLLEEADGLDAHRCSFRSHPNGTVPQGGAGADRMVLFSLLVGRLKPKVQFIGLKRCTWSEALSTYISSPATYQINRVNRIASTWDEKDKHHIKIIWSTTLLQGWTDALIELQRMVSRGGHHLFTGASEHVVSAEHFQ